MIRKVIIPHTKEDLLIQLPDKFMDVEIEIMIFPVNDFRDSDFEEVKENNAASLTQLSEESFSDVWETPENKHWDQYLADRT